MVFFACRIRYYGVRYRFVTRILHNPMLFGRISIGYRSDPTIGLIDLGICRLPTGRFKNLDRDRTGSDRPVASTDSISATVSFSPISLFRITSNHVQTHFLHHRKQLTYTILFTHLEP